MRRKALPAAKAVAFFYAATRKRPPGGRKARASALAGAEAEASARGWRSEWEGDPDGEDEAFGVIVRDVGGRVVAQRWGVRNGSRVHRRVVEAELALEALSEE